MMLENLVKLSVAFDKWILVIPKAHSRVKWSQIAKEIHAREVPFSMGRAYLKPIEMATEKWFLVVDSARANVHPEVALSLIKGLEH